MKYKVGDQFKPNKHMHKTVNITCYEWGIATIVEIGPSGLWDIGIKWDNLEGIKYWNESSIDSLLTLTYKNQNITTVNKYLGIV